MISQYTEKGKQNIASIVGSSDLLGNPSKTIGYMNKETKGRFGFVEGSQNMVAAGSGTISSVTSGVNSAMSMVTCDDEFNQKKQMRDMQEKPTGVGDGFVKGAKGLGRGIASGVVGVFTKPVQGARKSGADGFITGIGEGVAGFISKPVTGVVDMV